MNNLYDCKGRRLYLNSSERDAILQKAIKAPRQLVTFYRLLHFTACRISEGLLLTAKQVDFPNKVIVFETLKKRREGVYREVPAPEALLDTLDLVHGIREAQIDPKEKLWNWSRTTAWRKISELINAAGVEAGPHALPKGLRHGYGVNAVSTGVPLNMLSKWMGHSKTETTAIYTNALGAEQ